MTGWRTNLGGAISVTGTALIGIGVLPQLLQLSPDTAMLTKGQLYLLWHVAVVGFILSAVGKGVTALFAADAAQVKTIQDQMAQVPKAIETGDTTMLKKNDLNKPS